MFQTCMRDVRPYCLKSDRLLFEGIESGNKWLCDDGFDGKRIRTYLPKVHSIIYWLHCIFY